MIRLLPRGAARAPSIPALLLPLCGAFAAGCFGGPTGDAWNGPPFSADLVDLRNGGQAPTHVDAGVGKLRLVSASNGKNTAFVFDPQNGALLVIDDEAKTYVDAGMFSSMVAAGMGPMLRLFRPAADGDPCTVWNGTVNQFARFSKESNDPPHFTCTPMGSDAVNGRPAHKWSVLTTGGGSASNESGTVWIDDRLHILTKSIDANGSMEMRNVRDGAPSPDLFVPPAGYQKIGVTDFVAALAKAGGANRAVVNTPGNTSNGDQSAGDVLDKVKGMVKQP